MKEGPEISRIAALIGDPARANMLGALMDGRALTASELAEEAGISLSTASGHLSKLVDGDLLQNRKQGRHKYFALSDADVAAALEALMGLAANRGARRTRPGPRDAAMREARICYNHLAGRMGVQLYESLQERGLILEDGERVALTGAGETLVRDFGVDLDRLANARAPLCRSCLDWSERRSHLAGSVGRALFARMVELGWMQPDANSRAVRVSQRGKAAFDTAFPVARTSS